MVVTKKSLVKSWENCYSCFDHLKLYNVAAERCAQSLLLVGSRCLAAVSDNLGDQSNASTSRPPSSLQNELENPTVLPGTSAEMPFSEELFGDLRFDDDTFLDPYWFELQF
ncbi:hypothetical protein PENSUB_12463 [Penicillium subrubescens]|uniref:Uncharacterized protein n=2 Tax=Penicillium subrubescens TaxID=1316194 RepID=A0A1Q5SZM4_9EURO|nr:hypothetical protein PENSUB_12463 [Penicillium subrubescens]